jgi:hypothetical protein
MSSSPFIEHYVARRAHMLCPCGRPSSHPRSWWTSPKCSCRRACRCGQAPWRTRGSRIPIGERPSAYAHVKPRTTSYHWEPWWVSGWGCKQSSPPPLPRRQLIFPSAWGGPELSPQPSGCAARRRHSAANCMARSSGAKHPHPRSTT